MPTATDMLNMAAGIGQRQASFRFALIDAASGRPLGNIEPVKTPPTLSHDTSRAVARTLSGLVLDRADTAAVDVLSDRLRVYMTIGGAEYPLGTYVFTDTHRTVTTHGHRGEFGLLDLGFLVAQATPTTTSFTTNVNVGDAISDVLDAAGLPDGYTVEPTAAVLGSPIAWPAGTDRARVVADLATLGAYLTPYMGNDSVYHVRQSFDPAYEVAGFVFETGGQVHADSISESDDLLDAPNAFIVVDNANTESPIVGRYDVPPSAPHSAANRGFVVASVRDMQGLGSAAAADNAARAIGLAHVTHEQVTLSTPPDPRHDAYDVVEWDGVNWLETAWSLPLIEGAAMSHTLRRAYDPNSQVVTR